MTSQPQWTRRLLFASSLALALSPLSAGLAMAAEKVMWGTPARPTLSAAPMMLAINQGYFDRDGLEIEIVYIQGSGRLLPQIAQREVDIGWPNADILIKSRQPGKDPLPVVFFYNSSRYSVWEVVARADSGIDSIDDLENRTLGVGGMHWGNVPLTMAILTDAGLVPDENISITPVGNGAPAFQALNSGQVDAINLYASMHAILENTGVELNYLPLPDKFTRIFSNGMATHPDTIKERPEMLERFGRAYTKGIIACEANPEFCVRNFWEMYPEQVPQDVSEEVAMEQGLKNLWATLARVVHFPEGGERRFGEFPAGDWENFISVLHETGQIEDGSVDPAVFYTNEFVDAFNDFDKDALIAEVSAQ